MGLLLLSNITGLLLSQSYIVDGVPKEYISSLDGSMDLPFIPLGDISVEYNGPSESLATDPFKVEFIFPEGKIPTFPYRVSIVGENDGYGNDLLQTIDGNGNLSLSTILPGIKSPGSYKITIQPDLIKEPGVMDPFVIGTWSIDILENPFPHPIPVLYNNLAFGSMFSSYAPNDELTFDISGLGDIDIEDYSVETISGNISSLKNMSGQRWGLEDPGIFGRGWAKFNLIHQNETGFERKWEYLTYDPTYPIPYSASINASVRRVFTGTDELFDQDDEGSMRFDHDGELDLYVGEYYSMNIEVDDTDPRSSGMGVEVNGSMIFLPIRISIGKSSYPVTLTGHGTYEGIFKAPSSQEKDLELSMHLGYPNFRNAVFSSEVLLLEDHAPGFRISPDIYKINTSSDTILQDANIILSAEWENFNRKDFTIEPILKINGTEQRWTNESQELIEHNYTYQLDGETVYSGSTLTISSENSMEFANWLAFILPIPSVFIFIPVPIMGWFAVGWFILVSAACVASVVLLFFRTGKPIWEKGSKVTVPKRIRKLFSSESDLALTAKTYLGALFFFYAVYWMLLLFDQPTPVPGILSSETPIWIRMFLLADASVWEEISGRVVLIGIPLMIFYTFRKWRDLTDSRSLFFMVPWEAFRDIGLLKTIKNIQIKKLFGGTDHFGGFEIFLVLLSGGLFGLAHLGWGPWKVIPTFVHGLLFGYLFIKVGLHASIAMHFLFDYSSFLGEITGIYGPTMILVVLTALSLGSLFFGDWINRCNIWTYRNLIKRTPNPVALLVIHSLLSVMLGLFSILNGGSNVVALLFFSIPFVDLIVFLLWKVTRSEVVGISWILRGLLIMWSYVSWVASPFGIAWALDPDIDDQGS